MHAHSSSCAGRARLSRRAAAPAPLTFTTSQLRRPPSLLLSPCGARVAGQRISIARAPRAESADGQQPSSSSGSGDEAATPSLLDALEQRAKAGGGGDASSSSSNSALDSPLLKAITEKLEPAPPPPKAPQQQDGQQQATTTTTPSSPVATTTPTSSNPTIDAAVEIPPATLRRIRQEVFGPGGPFFVTEVESYGDGGAVFKGRVRAKDLSQAYDDLSAKLKQATDGEYQLFLLADRRDEPTAVVLPSTAREAEISSTTEWWLAIAFALVTLATSVDSAGVPLLQFLVDPFRTNLSASDVTDVLPLVAAEWGILFAHELGHRVAAKRLGVGLYAPLLIPSASAGFLPSFGAITRFRGFLPDRNTLLEVSAAGPAYGVAASSVLLLLGFGLTAAGATDVTIDSASLADSLLVGALAQLFVGADRLASAPEVAVSSALVAGWAGLTIQALNCLPLGELDGGRVSLALLGRRGARAVGVLGTAALAIASFSNALLGLWLLVVLILQRGPVLPCREELSDPPADSKARLVGALLLTAVPALVLLPFPVDLLAMGGGVGGAVTGGGAPLFGA